MIIVEGPDGAGKTTLIKQLQEAFQKADIVLPIAPRVVSKDAEAMVDLKEWTEQNTRKGFQPMIFDRHRLISEPIYGPILRDYFEPGFDNFHWLDWQLTRLYEAEPVMIYCLPPFHRVWENVRDDPENKVVAQFKVCRMIWSAYLNKALADYILGRAWIFDYTKGQKTLDLHFNALCSNINKRLKQEARKNR
jgi:hypothetical protein